MRPLTLFLHLLSNISILLLGCARAKIITEFGITVGNSDAQDSNSHRPKPTPQSSDALAQRNHPQRTMHPLGIVANEYLSRTGKINLVLVPIDFADLTGFPHPNGNDGLLSLFGRNGALYVYLRNMSNLDAFFEVSAAKLTRSGLTAQSIANSGDVRPLFNEIYTRLSALQDMSFADLYVLCTKQITGAATTSIRAWSHVEYGIWVNGYYSQPPYRELANLLGVGRADSRSAAGQVMAYGNQLDGAGSPFGYLNTVFGVRCKLEAGWLQDELHVITTFRNSGTYRLYTHDRNPSHSHRAIRLGFPGHKKYFFLDYRSFGGEGNAGNLLYPNERPANLTDPLVQGASLLWGYRNNPNTVLLNAATTGGQDGFNTPIPVGTSFDIHVNFDSTKPVYATVNVVGTGGSEDTSYLNVQITFASTPYCPFSPSGFDLCPTDIHAYEFGDTSTRQPLQIIQYAIKFSVYPHVRLTKLLNFWFNPEIPTCVDTLTVYIYDDSTTSTPGVLRVSDALVVANGTMSIRAGSPLSNFDSTTQLTYGNYWMAFKYTTTQRSICNFYSLPMPPNGAPTYAQGSNGSWFPTAFQLNLGFDFASEPINLPVDRIVSVRSYPTRLSAGKNFDTVVQYQNSLRLPAFLAAPGHISISARRKSDDVPINIGGVLELDTPTYSSSVTAINLLINEEGEFIITFRDTTFKLNSREPPTANTTPPLDTNLADVTPAAAIQYLGTNLTPTIRILQPLPSAITFSLNNSAGSRDTASANKIIRATESSGVLQNVQVPVTNGVAQFTNLQFAQCPAGNAAFVTFSLTDDPNVTTSLTMVVDTSLLGNWVLRFGDTADSSVTNGLKKLSVGVSENDSSLPVTVEATRGCDVDTTVNNVVITLTPMEPTAQLQNNVATMSDGVASFPNLSITFAGTIQQTQIVATPTWGPGGSGTLPNAITSEMNVQEVQEFTSIAIQLPSETFVLSQNQEVTPPIQIRALRSDGSLDKTFSGLVQVSIPDITLVGANATAVDGVAALTGLTMISCAPEVPVEMTVVATSGSGAMLQKTIPIQAQSQLGSNVVITSIPRQIPQYRPFSAILTIEDPCGARDTTANNMIATASVSEGSITGNVATVVTGVAYFPSIVLSNITDTTASIMFQITSANPSDPTLPMFNNGDDISVLIGTESNAVPRGPSASDLSLPRSQEFAVLLTQSDPVTFLMSEYISLLTTALFTVPEPSDVHLEITAQLWGAPTIIRHRCVFSQNTTIPITLPATSVDSELPVVLDVQDMPTLNQNLIELHRRVFLTAKNTLQDYGVPAGGATPLPLCPGDTCSAWGLAQRAPTLDADTCICTCSNFWGEDKCGSCLIEYLDSACLDCEFPGGEAPDCPSTSNAPGTYNPKTMSRGVMIGVGAAIGIVIAGGAILFFMKPPEEVPTF